MGHYTRHIIGSLKEKEQEKKRKDKKRKEKTYHIMNKAYLIAIGKSVRTIRTPALLVGANRMRSVIVYPLCIGPISSRTIKGNNPLKGEKTK